MRRARTIGELVAVFALLLAVLWRVGGAAGSTVAGIGAAAIVLGSWRHDGATLASLGLAPPAWRNGWASAAFFSLAGIAVLACAGIAIGSASLSAARFAWLADYTLGIAAQQLLLLGFFARGFDAIAADLPERRRGAVAIGGATATFVALHAPNPGLMLGVAIAGVFWVAHFRRHRNLLALLASHLVLGSAAMASLGPGPLWNLRVGAGALARLAR